MHFALLPLLLPSIVWGQFSGEVETIGFGEHFRPDCWTPMLVRITSDGGRSGTYQLRVTQDDLDGDRAVFTRTITLTGSVAGRAQSEERFWMYFIPQPTQRGLPDATRGAAVKDLQQQLKVSLCTEGGKELAMLPVTSTIINIDPIAPSLWASRRGSKLVVCVSDGNSQLQWSDYRNARGGMEDVLAVTLRPDRLPENVLGYEAVDAVVWSGDDPGTLRAGGEGRIQALEQFVRRGGRLVICQGMQWQKTLAFGDLLPVQLHGVEDHPDLQPLKHLASGRLSPREQAMWSLPKGPFKLARATAKDGSLVDKWIDWNPEGTDRTPWLVRRPLGLGMVVWVAQDLGDPAITARARSGWPFVWDDVMAWRSDTRILDPTAPTEDEEYRPANAVDLGTALRGGMDVSSRSAWYITLAVVFFIAYWVVAGPGSYLYLAARRRAHLSWFAFGLAALAATVLTAGVVKLIVRGNPDLRHITFVRVAPDQPAIVHSRFGLYIPRDGAQEIELKDAAPNAVNSLTALSVHPQHREADNPFPPRQPYLVPVRDALSDDPLIIDVPYRSTLKKLEATWIGQLPGGGIYGEPRIDDSKLLGTLTNRTGVELKDVYIAYSLAGHDSDWILYRSSWPDGAAVDLASPAKAQGGDVRIPSDMPLLGMLGAPGKEMGWDIFWYRAFRNANFAESLDERLSSLFPMLGLFDRLPTVKNPRGHGTPTRFELLRYGARTVDASAALAAGAMVVLARSEPRAPLPFPLEVEGDTVRGEGTVYYQFVLPIKRGTIDVPPTTTPEASPGVKAGGV